VRRLIAALAVVALALGFTVSAVGAANAALTSPVAGTVRGTITLSDTGGVDNSSILGIKHCGGSVRTTLQLVNSGGTVVFTQQQNGAGVMSVSLDTHNYPNGAYTVRGIAGNGENNGFGGFGCKTSDVTTTRAVTIDNITNLQYSGAISAPQNTVATVTATLTDPNLTPTALGGRVVSFALSGGTTVTGTTNASGVATASLSVAGPPRAATLTVSFAGTTFYKPSSVGIPFEVTKNATATTLAAPAPVVHGQTSSFTASVAAIDGTGVPTGTIQFTVDGNPFGSPVALSSGTATSQSDTFSTDTHTIGAVYSGDSNFVASTAATKTLAVTKAVTTTSLTSDVSPTVHGQTVTFTAQIGVLAPGVGAPTGGVQFNVDGQPFGTAVPLTGNTATLSIANLSTGNHTIDATYNGNADFASSSAAALTHGVNKAQASLDLSTSEANAVAGEPLTFTADVSAVGPGAGTPDGTVQFAVDGVNLGGPVTLTGGTATSLTAHLDAGPHLVTADYAGDDDFGGAMDSLTQHVIAAHTTTTVSSSPNPSVVGQTVTLHAEVTPVSPATGTPEGAIQFFIDGNAVGVFAQLDTGVAEIQVSTFSVGDHTVTAKYLSGDINFITSTSAPITQQVNKAATTVTVQSSAAPSVFGQPVTFTATVAVQSPGAGAPSGSITFTDGTTVLGAVPVNSGTGFQATLTTSTLSVSQHVIVATYSGDDSFLGSNGSINQKVNRAQTSTVVASSANPAQSGQGITFTASVAPVAPGAGLPTGTVRFTVNGANLGAPATLVNGVATSTTFASLSPGTYAIAATYNGDGNFVNSAGTLDQGNGQNVAKGATSMTLESDDTTADFGQAVTFTSTVKAVAPATGRPSGVVQVWEGSVLLGATSLSPAGANTSTAQFVTSTLTPGPHTIRAVYVGNFNFDGQTAQTTQSVGQTVTVTGLESSANPSVFGDDVTLTAVVTPGASAPGVPTGIVTFTEGGNVLGTAAVSSVQGRREASITLSGLTAGAHQVKATYSGDATYAPSTSTTFTQNVSRAASTLVAETLVTQVGDNAGRVRATLTGNGGAPLPGQTLVFTTTQNTDHGVIHICTVVTDANGYASCDATTLVGAINLDAGYDVSFAGNTNYVPAQDHGTYFPAAG
jgi:hypothetical protein